MALEIDIKANDDFEKSALRISEALAKIAKDEEKINALSKKLGVSSKQIAAGQKVAAADQVAETKKLAEAGEAKAKGEEEFRDKLKAGAAGLYLMKEAAIAVYDAVVKVGVGIGEAAFEADRARQGSAALVKAFSGDAGDSVIKQLDAQAKALGESVVDVRNQFVSYRKAGVDSQIADALIKTRADLIAMKVPAKEADEAVSKVLAAGHNKPEALAQLKFIKDAFKTTGDGAVAAKYALTSVSAAQAQIHDDVEEKLADVWKRIGPDIELAAHTLADFTEKLLDSDEGKEAIDDVVEAFHDLTSLITNENLTTGFNAIKSVAGAVYAVFDAIGTAIGFVASEIADFLGDAKLEDLLNPIGFLEKKAVGLGSSIVGGLVDGIAGSKNAADDTAASLAQGVGDSFAKVLKIHSPSKVFAGYGEDTVAGYEQGQEKAIGQDPMPLQQVASEKPIAQQDAIAAEVPVAVQRMTEQAAERPAVPVAQQAAPAQSSGSGGITIENLVVHGGGKPEEVARSIRQELQLLLRAGKLSRGQAA